MKRRDSVCRRHRRRTGRGERAHQYGRHRYKENESCDSSHHAWFPAFVLLDGSGATIGEIEDTSVTTSGRPHDLSSLHGSLGENHTIALTIATDVPRMTPTMRTIHIEDEAGGAV